MSDVCALVEQSVIDDAIDQRRGRLHACLRAEEYLLRRLIERPNS